MNPIRIEATVAIQCRSGDMAAGDFLFVGPCKLKNISSSSSRVSPVFENVSLLFDWCRNNGWKGVNGSAIKWEKTETETQIAECYP